MAFAQAIKRAGSTDPDKIVAEMEKTDMDGAVGHLAFYGRNDEFTHALKYGTDYVTGIFMQWQDGKQVCIWPTSKCPNKLEFPSFVKLPGNCVIPVDHCEARSGRTAISLWRLRTR